MSEGTGDNKLGQNSMDSDSFLCGQSQGKKKNLRMKPLLDNGMQQLLHTNSITHSSAYSCEGEN